MFTTQSFFRPTSSIPLAALLLLLVGCASAPPKEALSMAEQAIQAAERSGSSQYEPELLSSAQTKLNRAKKDVDEANNDEARRMADEARAEAILANAKAEAQKQAKETNEMKKVIEALKQETSRASEGQ